MVSSRDSKKSVKTWKALTGITYPSNGDKAKYKRVEIGAVFNDLPQCDEEWLLDCGAIEEVNDG
jgi:hypothetical protein